MIRLRKILPLLIVITFTRAYGQVDAGNIRADDPVLAQMDSLDVLHFFKHHNFSDDRNKLNIYNYPKDSIPAFTDEIYRDRMEKLDRETPFELDYNDEVRTFINLYAVKRRGTVAKCLGMAEMYFPLFEQKLSQHKMPLELKYLAIVESALNPTAKSRAGAGGLWQFMVATGKMYGLRVTSYIDERFDPEKSTEIACVYLKYLYKYFQNDWQLALAAYNCGAGNVNKAIRRSGGKRTFWEIRPFLPKETASYVPAFIAVNYIMAYHKEHNIYPNTPKYFSYEIDSIWVSKPVKFNQVTQYVNVPLEDLRILNPSYTLDYVPGGDYGYALYLPKNFIGDFLANEENIYKFSADPETLLVVDNTVKTDSVKKDSSNTNNQVVINNTTGDYKFINHKVEKGEYLSILARKYNVSIDSIKVWNKMTTEVIYIGQMVKIKVKNDGSNNNTNQYANNDNNNTNNSNQSTTKYHTIRSGDTLWALAQKYHTTVDNLKKWNKLYNGKTIYIGMKLIVKKA
jgi:membrane-bound lytic murein transglycosylase D